eukprot:SAG31_NODE_994_length_10499_cov_6.293452_2_plen_137_part_00
MELIRVSFTLTYEGRPMDGLQGGRRRCSSFGETFNTEIPLVACRTSGHNPQRTKLARVVLGGCKQRCSENSAEDSETDQQGRMDCHRWGQTVHVTPRVRGLPPRSPESEVAAAGTRRRFRAAGAPLLKFSTSIAIY